MPHLPSRLVRLLCVLVIAAAGAAAPANSEEAPAGSPITLRGAIEQALASNPRLREFAFRLRAQEGRGEQAALRPPLEFRSEIENVAGTGIARNTESAEATFALSRVIELGSRRARRIDAASAAAEVAEVERQAAQLDVVAEVTRRFIHVASDQAQLLLTRRATELARKSVDATGVRVNAARAPEVELRRARVELAEAQIAEEHAEHELLSSRLRLAATWGATDAVFGAATADLFALPALKSVTALRSQMAANPDLLRFASELRLRDAEVRLAEARARADVTVSAGVRRLEATNDQGFVLGFTMPLGASARAQPFVSEARALRELTNAEHETHRVNVYAQLFELYQEMKHAITEAQALKETVAPEMEGVLEATRYAFERGRYSYLEWADAQRELVRVQRDLIDAATRAHLLRAEIERLTGAPVAARSEPPQEAP
jgi:cobalt-zinc-cadmium efflux system outer membrane protein